MSNNALIPVPHQLAETMPALPAVVVSLGRKGAERFLEFFTANIRNKNTRAAYARAAVRFCNWCEQRKLTFDRLTPMHVAAYVEGLAAEIAAPSVKQHLAAIRMLFDWLVVGQVVPFNPAAAVKGPRFSYKKGKTPVLSAAEARQLLEAIGTEKLVDLRDRALIGVMLFSFARVGATLAMNVEDYYPVGKRWWIRLHEKNGKRHEVPVHHNLVDLLDQYLDAAGIAGAKKLPLFRSFDRRRQLTERRLHRTEALAMIKRRARRAGLPDNIGNHTFRGTGITAFLQNGGTIENAARIANHESTRTTQLYSRVDDSLTLDEIERVVIFGA